MVTNRKMFARIRQFILSDDGPTVTEYAVMLALIVLVCVGAISGIGTTVSGIFTTLDTSLPTGGSS